MTTNHEREVMLAEVQIELDEALRELRDHLDPATDQPWLRDLWASLRGIQRRLEGYPKQPPAAAGE